MTVTLHTQGVIQSGITGLNGGFQTINWLFFNDGAPLANVYKYFEIVGCRIKVSMASTTAVSDSFIDASVAYFPINYTKEGFISTAPSFESNVTELPGSVWVQYGAKNYGQWFYPQIKEQFSCSDAFGTSNRAAGSLVWYVNDAGVSELFGVVDIEVNVRFSQREYTATVPTFQVSQRAAVGASDDKAVPFNKTNEFEDVIDTFSVRGKHVQNRSEGVMGPRRLTKLG